jgi:hypothetical protein
MTTLPPNSPPRPDPQLSLLAGRLCRISYDGTFVAAELKALGFTATEFHLGSVCGFVTKPTETHPPIIAVEGTHDLASVMEDTACCLVADQDFPGKVHSGFSMGARVAYGAVRDLITGWTGAVRIIGHSLGAAIARQLGWLLQKAGATLLRGTLMGEPRSGDGVWAAGAQALPFDSFVNDLDPVPHLPPALLGYRHAGPRWWFDRHGSLVYDPGKWIELKDAMGVLLARLRRPQLLIDQLIDLHKLDTGYMPALERYAALEAAA